jgi:hypothetical protein
VYRVFAHFQEKGAHAGKHGGRAAHHKCQGPVLGASNKLE